MGWKERLRSEGVDLTGITDETRHRSPEPLVPPDDFAYVPDVLLDEPSVLDVDHEETRCFLVTNHQVTRCVPVLDPPVAHVLGSRYGVGTGYTQLALVEKRVVAFDGRLLGLWPRRIGGGRGECSLLLPPNGQGNLRVRVTWPTWAAVADAVDLSERTRGPVVMYGLVDECDWH